MDSKQVTLAELPAGSLFWHGDTLALKSEYREDNGAIDAFIVGSGEMFWGGTSHPDDQRKVLVTPAGKLMPSEMDAAADKYANALEFDTTNFSFRKRLRKHSWKAFKDGILFYSTINQ